MKLEAVFFDAGFTLVFPDLDLTLAPLKAANVHPTQEQLFAAERHAKHSLDAAHSHGDFGVDAHYWQTYYAHLLDQMHIAHDPALLDALAATTRRGVHWRSVRPGTSVVLTDLRLRYRLGVISNSDGSVEQLLDDLGLGQFFASVTDSTLCGCEKPDSRIFQTALHSLGVAPEHAIYIGDLYSIDYLGARAVGMQALLMDAAGVYAGTEHPRVSSLGEIGPYLRALESR